MLKQLIHNMLTEILPPEERNKEGVQETPERVARMWRELTAGYRMTVDEVICFFPEDGIEHDIIIGSDKIPFSSVCEHHLLPFFGHVDFSYIPKKNDQGQTMVLGLSKIGRLVDVFAKRLQTQERLTRQIATCLDGRVEGVEVCIQARHSCVECRGVEKVGVVTATAYRTGILTHRMGKR